MLVVARTADSRDGKLKPALFLLPTDAPGLSRSKIEMEIVSPENQFQLFFDEVRVPSSRWSAAAPTPACRPCSAA